MSWLSDIWRPRGSGLLLEEFEAEFFDDGIGEDVAGDLFDFLFGGVFGEAVEVEDEKFALTDALNFGMAQR